MCWPCSTDLSSSYCHSLSLLPSPIFFTSFCPENKSWPRFDLSLSPTLYHPIRTKRFHNFNQAFFVLHVHLLIAKRHSAHSHTEQTPPDEDVSAALQQLSPSTLCNSTLVHLKISRGRQVGKVRDSGREVQFVWREQIWRLKEEQKDREWRKVKLPGVCQPHVTGVGVHYSTGFPYTPPYRCVSLCLFCRHETVFVKFVWKKPFVSSVFPLACALCSALFVLPTNTKSPWQKCSVMVLFTHTAAMLVWYLAPNAWEGTPGSAGEQAWVGDGYKQFISCLKRLKLHLLIYFWPLGGNITGCDNAHTLPPCMVIVVYCILMCLATK